MERYSAKQAGAFRLTSRSTASCAAPFRELRLHARVLRGTVMAAPNISTNFAFLAKEFPHAADGATLAERSVNGDPRAFCLHARHTLEQLVKRVCRLDKRLTTPRVQKLDGYMRMARRRGDGGTGRRGGRETRGRRDGETSVTVSPRHPVRLWGLSSDRGRV